MNRNLRVMTDWRDRREAHRQRVGPWITAHRERAAHGIKHPVHDFLFTYYSFRPAHLFRWSPGVGVALAGCPTDGTDWPRHFVEADGGVVIDARTFAPQRIDYLHWAIEYLDRVEHREPVYHCFGLHEWAMVYQSQEVRHATTPLRVSPAVIAATVEAQGLRCTHYDAFRFFTPEAVPLNRIALTRVDAIRHDQPGCIHATMDLYKFGYTIAPFTSSDVIADAFELAVTARGIDMRASPYDLRHLGYEPIEIESKSGREHYVQLQRELMERAQPLRRRLRWEYEQILAAVTQS